MKKKNRLHLPAIMLIFIGLVIIILACIFTFLDPNIEQKQLPNTVNIEKF